MGNYVMINVSSAFRKRLLREKTKMENEYGESISWEQFLKARVFP